MAADPLYPQPPGKAVTRAHLEASGLAPVQVERLMYDWRLSEARMDLLRELVAGRECEQRGGNAWKPDCGRCTVCRARYTHGALVAPLPSEGAA